MPPRKKAAAKDSDASTTKKAAPKAATKAPKAPPKAPTRASTRNKAPVAGTKRARGDSDSEEEVAKPTSKKAKPASKKAKVDTQDANDDDDKQTPEPPKKMVPNTSICFCTKLTKRVQVTVIKRGAAPVDPQSGYIRRWSL